MKKQITNKKIKVVVISPLPLWGEGDKSGMPSIYYGVKGFIDFGHEAHFICPFEPVWKKNHLCHLKHNKNLFRDYEGINIYIFKWHDSFISKVIPSFASRIKGINWFYQIFRWIIFSIFGLIKVLQVSKKVIPNVIYGYNYYSVPAAYIAAKIVRKPIIIRQFGTFLYKHIHNKLELLRYFPEVLSFRIPVTYQIITDDGTLGDKVAKSLGVPREKLKFWKNGVDKTWYDPNFDVNSFKQDTGIPNNTKIVLSVGRLDSWKRVDRLITALPEVISMYKDVKVLILGEGSQRQRLEELSHGLGVSEYIKFLGAIKRDEVTKYMNAADVFVSFYDFSNLSNALLEAMVCAKCIVTLNVGTTNEVIKNRETGILVDSNSLNKLPEIILEVLNDDNLRESLGKNARSYAVNYLETWEERIQKEVRLIEKLVNNGE